MRIFIMWMCGFLAGGLSLMLWNINFIISIVIVIVFYNIFRIIEKHC